MSIFGRKEERKEKKEKREKLEHWREIVARDEAAYAAELTRMDEREALYRGSHDLRDLVKDDGTHRVTPHLRNIIAEAVEGQISSDIPMPKVTARHREDEDLALIIEHMLKNEIDRLPVEFFNDQQERTVPIQGGGFALIDWDSVERTHTTAGEVTLTYIHPKQVIPQDGVYTGIEDMDHITLKLPQTKEYIRRRYDVDVTDEAESDPDIKGDEGSTAHDLVTQYIVYYRNDQGGIGLFSYVNDKVLEDLADYQARRLKRCTGCGRIEPMEGEEIDGKEYKGGDECPYCGGIFATGVEGYEEVITPIRTRHGLTVSNIRLTDEETVDENGQPLTVEKVERNRIPFYKPDMYPILQQKNVSLFGRFMGDSDVDKIEDQQNTIARLEMNIIEKLIAGGTYMSLPNDCNVKTGPENMKIIPIKNIEDKGKLGVYDMQGSIAQDLEYVDYVYKEHQQIIGLTESYLGRVDRTATSGKAKEFSAAQAAGRLESKRRMKDAFWANVYEAIFKLHLAYTDEPRPIVFTDNKGRAQWDEFSRYDFLKEDEAGEIYWNDEFLFSCDNSATLSNNREAMWQETRSNFESGGFGDPTDINTLILYWTKMDLLHYPGAKETKEYLEGRLQAEAKAQQAAEAEVTGMLEDERAAGAAAALSQQIASQAMNDARADMANEEALAAEPEGVEE